jgi:hypothetical protein
MDFKIATFHLLTQLIFAMVVWLYMHVEEQVASFYTHSIWLHNSNTLSRKRVVRGRQNIVQARPLFLYAQIPVPCVCVCEMCVCVCVWCVWACVCVCVWERERERKRQCVCVCVRVSACKCVPYFTPAKWIPHALPNKNIHTHTHVYVYMCIHIYVYIYI